MSQNNRVNFSMHGEHRHILMTGGGTLGPVTPLLALMEAWKKQDPSTVFSWIGTPTGPEVELLEEKDVSFYELSAPKLDRYNRWSWLMIVPRLIVSCIRAFALLKTIQPHMVFTAGGYVSVPVVWTARLLRIPCWVHQLDVVPGVANKIMAPFAKKVTVTWEESASAFPARKTSVVGGLVRPALFEGDSEAFRNQYQLERGKPTVCVFGGGTGAQSINDALQAIVPDLRQRMNVVHLAGKGKLDEEDEETFGSYVAREFFTNMADLYAVADLIVARAGMGTILEIIALRKPTILIPIPDSHQEANAEILERRRAAQVVHELNPQVLKQEIERLMFDQKLRGETVQNLRDIVSMGAAGQIIFEAEAILKR